jgi:hypothetical protein
LFCEVAAESSGYAGQMLLLFGKKNLKTVCLVSSLLIMLFDSSVGAGLHTLSTLGRSSSRFG